VTPSAALQFLGAGGADKFHLLFDESHRAFRDDGCYDRRPQHGLFLIDGNGVIRARNVGDLPFSDTAEAIRRIRGSVSAAALPSR
jgi:hypothetical protein